MYLLTTRRFLPLFVTQFLGAFNDNLFKNALVMLIAFKLSGEAAEHVSLMVIIAGALFILPYFLFSATAGQFADKIDRAKMARYTKIWEILIVLVGAVGFIGHYPIFLLIVLFALGVQATFFGPIKYALLPQHLREDELLTGNAYIEAATFLAILLGTIAGGVLIMYNQGEYYIVASSFVVAIAGYIASRYIPQAAPPSPALKVDYNIFKATWHIVQHDRKNPHVFRCILAISWFWLVGAVFLSQFPALVKEVIGGDESLVTLFLAIFSIGIGFGSFMSSALTKGVISSRYVAPAALAMGIFAADLAWVLMGVSPSELPIGVADYFTHVAHIRIVADLFLLAVAGGVFIVPLYAIMQHDSAPESRARTIATNNVINALFMVLSAVATIALFAVGFEMPHLFAALAVGNVFVAVILRDA